MIQWRSAIAPGGAALRKGVEDRPAGTWRGRASRQPASQTDIMAFSIKKIGLIGAGQMGSGLAHVCSLAGFEVKLNDVSGARIKAGFATINGNMARQVSKKRISEDERQAALKRITAADKFDDF